MKYKLTPFDHALWAALPMAHTSQIEGRLTMILDRKRRRALPRRAFILGVAFTAAALVPLAMLKPTAKAQTVPAATDIVQIVGVADVTAPSTGKWDRNGNMLQVPALQPPALQRMTAEMISAPPGQKALGVAFRIPAPLQQSARVVVNNSDAPLGRLTMTTFKNGNVNSTVTASSIVAASGLQMQLFGDPYTYTAAFPASLTSADFQVGVASGQGTETVDCPKTVGKVRLHKSAGDVIFTLFPHPQGGAVFMVSDHFRRTSTLKADNPLQVALHDGENYERSVYALDKSGKVLAKLPVTLNTWPDAMGAMTQDYRSIKTQQTGHLSSSLLRQTASFRLVARPYQWTEFKNVALQPSAQGLASSFTSGPDQQETLRLNQARQIREHLAAWAQSNKAELLRMQQAQSNDLAALMPVYRSLEKQPLPLWPGDPRVGKGRAMPGFSTQTTEMTLTHLQRSKEPIYQGIRQDFAAYRDFRISRSVDPGNVCIVVWASGRITGSTQSSRFMGHGKPFLEVESQKSIMPGFFASPGGSIGGRSQYSIADAE